jgi:hypothetical protein
MFHVSPSTADYRCPTGPPGPALARTQGGPFNSVPCLARLYVPPCRAEAAHRLHQWPKPGPAGLFRAGRARNSPTRTGAQAAQSSLRCRAVVETEGE